MTRLSDDPVWHPYLRTDLHELFRLNIEAQKLLDGIGLNFFDDA